MILKNMSDSSYFLLPFYFRRLNDKEILVNEVGDYLIVSKGTAQRIVYKQVEKDEELFHNLLSNYFISLTPVPELIDVYAVRLRTKKAFLDHFTALHIFVLTLRCNQNCVYCQASSQKENACEKDMKADDLKKAVELMFKSPSPHLTMEFQGGEPTLAPHLIRFAVEYAEKINVTEKRKITYVLCTNCVNLTNKILDICKQYNILISTSLDGHAALHNRNRGKTDSYEKVVDGIEKARNVLGADKVSALMTTSIEALNYPKEIIDTYLEHNFHSMFLRGLNPYGLAVENTNWEEYNEHFIEVYKLALEYIIELNKQGKFFVEEFTALILRKILTPFPTGFVDLQSPAGAINGVIAYNYDGYVYASDESRMLAEMQDYTFRLGKVSDKYEAIFYGQKSQKISKIWVTECIAGCSDCAYHSYCGADPVRNYSTQDDMYGHRPISMFCKKHKTIIDYLFTLLAERKDEVLPIFKSWINNTCS
jgi:His-Xaa-Ser system radical SAM maturase HxsB